MNDRCANCDRELESWPGDPKNRPPCPHCGATGRIVELRTGDDIGLAIEEQAQVERRNAIVAPAPFEVKVTFPQGSIRTGSSALQESIATFQADHARLFLVTDVGDDAIHAQVRDERGQVLGEGLGDSMEDALLELSDHLLDRDENPPAD